MPHEGPDTMNVYRVTVMIRPESQRGIKQRPPRGSGANPRSGAPKKDVVFETKTFPATSIVGAAKRAMNNWPNRRIVAIEEVSTFNKNVYSDEILTEIFEVAHTRGVITPIQSEFTENDINPDDDEKAELILEICNTLAHMNIIPGLSANVITESASPDDEVMLMIADHYSGANYFRARSYSLRDFGSDDIYGWDWVIALTQEIIDYAAPLT